MKTKYIASASIGLIVIAGQVGAEIVGHERYAYDPAGNIIEKRIDDQVTRFDYEANSITANSHGITYLKDRAGRLIGEFCDGRCERKISYEYGDRATMVDSSKKSAKLIYNAEGHLVASDSGMTPVIFAWDGLGIVLHGDQVYSNEEHIGGGIPAISGYEVVATDVIGSSLSISNRIFESTAFGEGLEKGLFTGKPFIPELDSFLFKYRNYNPEIARWNELDPSGFPDGQNNALYVNNDPCSKLDPSGLAEAEYLKGKFTITPTGDGAQPAFELPYKFLTTFSYTLVPTKTTGTEGWDNAPTSGDYNNDRTYEVDGKPIVSNFTAGNPDNIEYKYKYTQNQWDAQFTLKLILRTNANNVITQTPAMTQVEDDTEWYEK
jgi:RHS repeat-associated protein